MKAKRKKQQSVKAHKLTVLDGHKPRSGKSNKVALGNPSDGKQALFFRDGLVWATIPQGYKLPVMGMLTVMPGRFCIGYYTETVKTVSGITTGPNRVYHRQFATGDHADSFDLYAVAIGISPLELRQKIMKQLNKNRLEKTI